MCIRDSNAVGPHPLEAEAQVEAPGTERKPEKRIQHQKGNGKNEEKPGFPDRGNYALKNFQGLKDTKKY